MNTMHGCTGDDTGGRCYLLVVCGMTQALQVLWNAEIMIREPLQVKFPLLTASGRSNVLDVMYVLISLCSCPPVYTHSSQQC